MRKSPPFTREDLETLRRLNALRATVDRTAGRALEESLEGRFGAASRLVVYGTLAPGESNHSQLAGLPGVWTENLAVRGEISLTDWSGMPGYPAFRWSEDAGEVSVKLFESPKLPEHWPRLDRFEGPGYRRILVPVRRAGQVVAVGNCYEALSRGVG